VFDEILWLSPGASLVPVAERLTGDARDLIPLVCDQGHAPTDMRSEE
jgi:hypothetical protein